MKVYIVNVESKNSGAVRTSREGYTSYDDAKAFVEKRGDNPVAMNEWIYEGSICIYEIVEVSIK